MAETEQIENNAEMDALKFLEGTAPFIMNRGQNPHVFSNEPYNPVPYGLLDLFYRMVDENRVGIIESRDSETEEGVLVLCFVGDTGDGTTELYPVARLLKEEETVRYLAPTGDGGYYDPAAVTE